jgi:hypothetical protein
MPDDLMEKLSSTTTLAVAPAGDLGGGGDDLFCTVIDAKDRGGKDKPAVKDTTKFQKTVVLSVGGV